MECFYECACLCVFERERECISLPVYPCTCLRAAQSRLATSLLGPTLHGEKLWVHDMVVPAAISLPNIQTHTFITLYLPQNAFLLGTECVSMVQCLTVIVHVYRKAVGLCGNFLV